MKKRRIVDSRNHYHECAHYGHQNAKKNSAEIKFLQLIEQVYYKQDKNGGEDHFCQIGPMPFIAIKHIGQKQAAKYGRCESNGISENDRPAKLKG